MKNTASLLDETRKAIQLYINRSEYFAKVYFWKPPASADSRRRYEKNHSFVYEGDGVTLRFIVTCSCKHIYVDKAAYIGSKKVNVRSLKKLLEN